MADLYRIKIDKIQDETVTSTIYLHNFQAADLPANKNVALQIIMDSFFHMKEMPEDINLSRAEIVKLLSNCSETELSKYSDMLHKQGKVGNEKFLAISEILINSVIEVSDKNWDKVDLWIGELDKGTKPDRTQIEAPSIQIQFQLSKNALHNHLKAGLEWTTPMWDREEF